MSKQWMMVGALAVAGFLVMPGCQEEAGTGAGSAGTELGGPDNVGEGGVFEEAGRAADETVGEIGAAAEEAGQGLEEAGREAGAQLEEAGAAAEQSFEEAAQDNEPAVEEEPVGGM